MKKELISTNQAAAAIGPYSQAIKVGNLVFTSGQLPIDYIGELVSSDISDQTQQCLENVQAILEEAGSDMSQVVKCTVFVMDMNDFDSINKVYATFFEKPYPARTLVEVSKLPKNAKIEIEAVAVIEE